MKKPSTIAEQFRSRGLAPSTRDTYTKILARAGDDPAAWAREKADGAPTGTILPMRAAVKHLLVSEYGMTEAEADEVLPASQGRPSRMRHALGPQELSVYLEASARIRSRRLRCLFAILPRTGLRIGEALALRVADIEVIEGRKGLRVLGKGSKERFIPLSTQADAALTTWLEHLKKKLKPTENDWCHAEIFPITAEAVRKVMRRMRSVHPELGRLTPHVLRHTFATLAIGKHVNMRTLQAALGHASIATTAIYAHPSVKMIGDAVDLVDTP